MRVLVTGASGMFGRAVADALVARGDAVTVFQRRPSGVDCLELLGDVADPVAVGRAARGNQAIVHMAARVSPTGSRQSFEATNVVGTTNVLAWARSCGADRVVYVSSPSVAHTGTPHFGCGAAPADPERSRTHYARTKAIAELAVLRAASDEMAVVAVRPHLVWGPGDTQLVDRVVKRARAGQLALIGSGAALVDTTYIDNAVGAVLAALDRAEEASGRALVVTNGQPRPVAELLRRLCDAAGVTPPVRRVPLPIAKALGAGVELAWAALRLDVDPPMTRFLAEQLATAHWYDQRTTHEVLQWRPEVDLDEGFERLAAWYRSR